MFRNRNNIYKPTPIRSRSTDRTISRENSPGPRSRYSGSKIRSLTPSHVSFESRSRWSGNSCASHSSAEPSPQVPYENNSSVTDRYLDKLIAGLEIDDEFNLESNTESSQNFIDFCIKHICLENVKFLMAYLKSERIRREDLYLYVTSKIYLYLIGKQAIYPLNLSSSALTALDTAFSKMQRNREEISNALENANMEIRKITKDGIVQQFMRTEME